jgi:putative lipoprotein
MGVALVQCLLVLGCESSGSSTGTFPLVGTSWRADEIERRPIDSAEASTLRFDSDQRASGSTGCNLYTAPMSASDTSIQLGLIATTRRACPPAIMDQETRFLAALQAARGYRQEGDRLQLLDQPGRTILRFTRT